MADNRQGDEAPMPAARFEQGDDFQALALLQDEAEDAAFVIAGRYEVLSTLGQGGMGAVYKARDTRLGRIVAIKTILPQLISQPQASRRVFAGPKHWRASTILTVYDSGNDDAQHFLVMQLGDRDLVHVLERHGGPLPLAPALHVALAVARALDYAHQRAWGDPPRQSDLHRTAHGGGAGALGAAGGSAAGVRAGAGHCRAAAVRRAVPER